MFKKACPESFRRVYPARPQPFPAFVAHFGGVGLTRGEYTLYVSTEKWRPAYAKPLSAFVAHFGEVGSAGMEPLACQPWPWRRLAAFFNIP